MENFTELLIEEIKKLRLSIETLIKTLKPSPSSPKATTPVKPKPPSNATPPNTKVGEILTLDVQDVGREPTQGVSFFEGWKVIINGAGGLVGKTIDVEVVRILPTALGFIIFSKI